LAAANFPRVGQQQSESIAVDLPAGRHTSNQQTTIQTGAKPASPRVIRMAHMHWHRNRPEALPYRRSPELHPTIPPAFPSSKKNRRFLLKEANRTASRVGIGGKFV